MAQFFLWLMSLLYIAAGINHFAHPKMYLRIMPPYVPYHSVMVMISGVAEIVLGLLLLFPATRVMAAWGIVVMLVLIFPANIQMAIDFYRKQNPYLWVAVLRLPLQFVLIWWAYRYTR